MIIDEAKAYTGNPKYWGLSGEAQLELLKAEGLLPSHNLLEVGCGSLNAGIPLVDYLDADKYVGIEPNEWLVDAAWDLVEKEKYPLVISTPHFDVTTTGRLFDYVIGHSVFSHAPEWQLIQCLHNLISVLHTESKLYFSLHLAPTSSDDVFWKDNGNTFYELDIIKHYAEKLGYDTQERSDMKLFFMQSVPCDNHDWIQFVKL